MKPKKCIFYKKIEDEEPGNIVVTYNLCINKKISNWKNKWKKIFGFYACGCDLWKNNKCTEYKEE